MKNAPSYIALFGLIAVPSLLCVSFAALAPADGENTLARQNALTLAVQILAVGGSTLLLASLASLLVVAVNAGLKLTLFKTTPQETPVRASRKALQATEDTVLLTPPSPDSFVVLQPNGHAIELGKDVQI